MKVRVAEPKDKDICVEFLKKNLSETAYGPFFSLESIEKSVWDFLNGNRNEGIALLILDENDKEIGLVSFEVIKSHMNIKVSRIPTVYLEPDHRGKGLMKEIREAFEFWSNRVGCSFCNIGVIKDDVDLTKDGYTKYEVMYIKDIR